MENAVTIITIKDYGKIEICLKELLNERGLTRNYLAKASNTRFEVINKWYSDKVEKLDLDVPARICYVLNCSPSDIIRYNKRNTEQTRPE